MDSRVLSTGSLGLLLSEVPGSWVLGTWADAGMATMKAWLLVRLNPSQNPFNQVIDIAENFT